MFSAGIAAVIWGIWWVPIRTLEPMGLHGAWAGLVMNSGALLLALIVLAVMRKGLVLDRRAMLARHWSGWRSAPIPPR